MPKGRPPKPIAKHVAEGTFRKHRHAPRVIAFPRDEQQPADAATPVKSFPPPKSLKGEAKKWWEEFVPALAAMGLLERIDVSVLEMLAETYAQWRERLKNLKRYPMLRDNQIAERDAKLEYHKLAVEFGFTPTSRARLKVGPAENKPQHVARRQRGAV